LDFDDYFSGDDWAFGFGSGNFGSPLSLGKFHGEGHGTRASRSKGISFDATVLRTIHLFGSRLSL
jgi:hypothetical protein